MGIYIIIMQKYGGGDGRWGERIKNEDLGGENEEGKKMYEKRGKRP